MALLENDLHDDALRAHVAPSDWINPQADGRYNLVVVGGGTAGLVASAAAAGLGAKVALVERHLLGGDCLNYGCVPSKALLRAARMVAEIREAGRFGVESGGEPRVEFHKVMERMRRLRAEIGHHDGAARFRDLGVEIFLGEGRFSGADRVAVDGRELRFSRALIATGGRAVMLPVPGLADADPLTNETLFTLTELPKRLTIVGAGPIGCEMAQAFNRFGSKVTVVSLDDRILPREDPEASALVRGVFEREGVVLELGAALESVEVRGGEKIVHWKRDGRSCETAGDQILLGVGRRPNTDGLGLEEAGVDTGDRGRLVVDEFLRTTNPRIFAAGDVAGTFQFTHAADAMARLVIRNAFFFGRGRQSALTMAWCTYTSPEIGHVGLYAGQEKEAGCELEELKLDLKEVDRFILDGEREGFAKAIVEKKTGRLRGATVVGEHAGEMLGEACLAVTQRMKVTAWSGVIHPYPTQASVWSRIGDLANRGRLTPGRASLLKSFLKWRR